VFDGEKTIFNIIQHTHNGMDPLNFNLMAGANQWMLTLFTFEQYIPVLFINNHKHNCIRESKTTCYSFSNGVYYTLSDMFRPIYNGCLQASVLGGVVNTIQL
jgi:hypothetical protein